MDPSDPLGILLVFDHFCIRAKVLFNSHPPSPFASSILTFIDNNRNMNIFSDSSAKPTIGMRRLSNEKEKRTKNLLPLCRR